MLTLQYWIGHYSRSLEVRRYFPAEFTAQNPAHLDERTLVALGSKSGTTLDEAAEFLPKASARVQVILLDTRLSLKAMDERGAPGNPDDDVSPGARGGLRSFIAESHAFRS
jgi:fructoselysine 6-phosphate deglycase